MKLKGFFFVEFGIRYQTLTLSNIKLKTSMCPLCKKPTRINLKYVAEASEMYWIRGRFAIKKAYMLCLGCGKEFELERYALLWALKLFREMTEKEEKKYPGVKKQIRILEAELKDEEEKQKHARARKVDEKPTRARMW